MCEREVRKFGASTSGRIDELNKSWEAQIFDSGNQKFGFGYLNLEMSFRIN